MEDVLNKLNADKKSLITEAERLTRKNHSVLPSRLAYVSGKAASGGFVLESKL